MITAHTEGSHSGLVRRLGKAVSGKLDREFESLTLRIIALKERCFLLK